MEYSVRLNGFLSKGYTLESALEAISTIEEVTHVDLNYPEHFKDHSLEQIKDLLKKNHLLVSSVASRFRNGFQKGEFTNPDNAIREEAVKIAMETSDMAKALECNHVILWFGMDGWTYAFEVDYKEIWDKSLEALRRVCDHNKDVDISIEYKPFEPRTFSLFHSASTTALMAKEVNRDNIFVTIDLAHSYMKDEMPGFAVSLLTRYNLLSAVHVNDGYGLMDDGMMVGSVRFIQALEFYYYLIKSDYKKAIYFDTFPVREDPVEEVKQNVRMSKKIEELVHMIGLEKIGDIISKNDAVAAQEIMMMCLK